MLATTFSDNMWYKKCGINLKVLVCVLNISKTYYELLQQ